MGERDSVIGPIQIVVVAALLALAAYLAFRTRSPSRLGVPSPILPASELQRQHGLYAENRPALRLDSQRVPPHLHDLIPLAETWGIGDDIIRFDFEQKATETARRELVTSLGGRLDAIQEWLDSQPRGQAISEEAAAFMYLLAAYDEVRPPEGEAD